MLIPNLQMWKLRLGETKLLKGQDLNAGLWFRILHVSSPYIKLFEISIGNVLSVTPDGTASLCFSRTFSSPKG